MDHRRGSGRTWTVRGVLTGTLAALVVVGAATVAATSPHTTEVTRTSAGFDVRPSVRALAAGCGVMRFVTEPTSKVGWVDYDGELVYWPDVPIIGWFAATPPKPGATDPTPEQVLNGMWRGDRAIWVAADAPGRLMQELTDLAAANPQWRWPTSRIAQMDPGTFAVASWGVTQSCASPDVQVISGVLAAAPPAPGAKGGSPPPVFRLSAEAS
jgi:hypothetical protein